MCRSKYGSNDTDVKLAINGNAEVELLNKPVGAPPNVDEIVERTMRL